MALPPLATVEDLEGRLGRTLTGPERTRAELLLGDASAAIRAWTGQALTAGSSTVSLYPRSGVVRLPQEPVTAITAVEDDNGDPVGYAWDRNLELGVDAGIDRVTITYEHGYEELPGELVALVCQVAGRAMGTPPDEAGYTSETIGNYSYSLGGTAAAGALGLLDDEKAALEPYRRRARMARIGLR